MATVRVRKRADRSLGYTEPLQRAGGRADIERARLAADRSGHGELLDARRAVNDG